MYVRVNNVALTFSNIITTAKKALMVGRTTKRLASIKWYRNTIEKA